MTPTQGALLGFVLLLALLAGSMPVGYVMAAVGLVGFALGFALRDLFDDRADRVDLEDPRLLRFLEGYRSLRPLDPAEFMALPLFLAHNHLVHFGDLLRVLEDAPQAGDPAWSLELRQKLEGKLNKYRQVFAAWAQQ